MIAGRRRRARRRGRRAHRGRPDGEPRAPSRPGSRSTRSRSGSRSGNTFPTRSSHARVDAAGRDPLPHRAAGSAAGRDGRARSGASTPCAPPTACSRRASTSASARRSGPVQVDADRSGYVVATARRAADALDHADRASKLLVVETGNPSWRRRPPWEADGPRRARRVDRARRRSYRGVRVGVAGSSGDRSSEARVRRRSSVRSAAAAETLRTSL